MKRESRIASKALFDAIKALDALSTEASAGNHPLMAWTAAELRDVCSRGRQYLEMMKQDIPTNPTAGKKGKGNG